MSIFAEIYGFEEVLSRNSPVPGVPLLDDPLWQFTPESDRHAGALNKIENDAFANALLGDVPTPETALADTPALAEFRKTFPSSKPVPIFELDMNKACSLMKAATIAKNLQAGAPKRSRALAGMLKTFRSELETAFGVRAGACSDEAMRGAQQSGEKLLEDLIRTGVTA